VSSIVVDTNVFVHSCNHKNNRFNESVDFLNRLKSSSVSICLDAGFDMTEAKNTSRIWSEYIAHIPDNSVAKELIAELFVSNRIKDVPTKVPIAIHKIINQNISDVSDRVFIKVSRNSQSISLVSHDHMAFPNKIRNEFRKKDIANIVICSEENCD
jgi:GTPase Era involved in 16S rRNA processing